jgi:hypothetical protein
VTALFAECAAIAAREGFAPRPEFAEHTRAMLTAPGSAMTASILREIERCVPVEADHILGDLLRHTKVYEARPSAGRASKQTGADKGLILVAHLSPRQRTPGPPETRRALRVALPQRFRRERLASSSSEPERPRKMRSARRQNLGVKN